MKTTTKESSDKLHVLAILSYVPLLCFITFFSFDKLDEFSKAHAKQGIILLIIEVIALLFLIDIVSQFFWLLVLAIALFLSIAGMLRAALKQSFHVPFFGEILKKYDL